MSNDFDQQLRDALRPVDPDESFAQRVMVRIADEPRRSRRPHLQRARWASVALAASVLLGIVVFHQWQLQREQHGIEARNQLIEALRVTGEKLDIAYRAINEDSHPGAGESSRT
jgi:negative regulator of sigma E activity